ncbi:hypothetical protein ETB97_008290 [Aspergillus alliaceus]|uniref:Tryptophan synthase beta chain-like PALP domain-containing protein n=1 Tax=Petromyces alliaceus TaxID=209559 RepID=A0A8H5ZVG0_PETAA|nr:hypothetical protein ETB97_008290 [Aspergillus burnettii]
MGSVNPTDSYKDRMAKSIVKEAEARGALKPGMTVLKATGGSTVSSLAFICAAKGYQFQVESSNAFSLEDLPTMQTWGLSFDLIHSPSAPSSVITKGHTEMHHVEGIGSGFMPPHLDRNLYDEARAVTEEARTMCPRLAKEAGLLVKTSPGLNVAAAIALVKQLGPDRTVATVAVDTGL